MPFKKAEIALVPFQMCKKCRDALNFAEFSRQKLPCPFLPGVPALRSPQQHGTNNVLPTKVLLLAVQEIFN